MTYEEFKTACIFIHEQHKCPVLAYNGEDEWINGTIFVLSEYFRYDPIANRKYEGHHCINEFIALVQETNVYNELPMPFTEADIDRLRLASEPTCPDNPQKREKFFRKYVRKGVVAQPELAAFVASSGGLYHITHHIRPEGTSINFLEAADDKAFLKSRHFVYLPAEEIYRMAMNKEKTYLFSTDLFPKFLEIDTPKVLSLLQYWQRYIEEYEAGRETND